MSTSSKPCCGNCVHFIEQRDLAAAQKLTQVVGSCRRYPPQVLVLPTPQGITMNSTFPHVQGDNICGEFQHSVSFNPLKS